MKNNNSNTNKVGQAIMIITSMVFLLSYGLALWFTWDKGFWTKDDYSGDIFGPGFDSITYAFNSRKNFFISTGLPVISMIILLILLYKLNTGKKISSFCHFLMIGPVSVLSTIVLYIVMFNKCTPLIAFFYNFSFGTTLLLFIPWLVTGNSCPHCGAFNSLTEEGRETKTKTHTNYVPGGYRTTSSDIKDDTGSVVGTIETRRYEEGYHYNTTSSTTTINYVCKQCGKTVTKTRNS